jgi:Ca2+-binding RTX toxin-like protein
LGGAQGFGEITLPRADDTAFLQDISAVFGQDLRLFGQVLSPGAFHVGLNGIVSFGQGIAGFPPDTGFAGGPPVIAPFWADVDVRLDGEGAESGAVYLDVDPVADIVTVTWDHVGRFRRDADTPNTFQVQLIDHGGGDFDIVFRYQAIGWTSGDLSGGSPALIGIAAGETVLELPASGDAAAQLALPSTSGIGGAGLWQIAVRDGAVSGTIVGAQTGQGITGGAGADQLIGGSGADTIDGGGGADTLDGGGGDDLLTGGDGDDRFIPGTGADTVDGGAGFDAIRFDFSFADAVVTAPGPGEYLIARNGSPATTTARGVERLDFIDLSIAPADAVAFVGVIQAGGVGNDTLVGSAAPDFQTGNDGNDRLIGGGGDDTLVGGAGNDTFEAGSGDDRISGGAGDDTLIVGPGIDRFDGGPGFDVMIFDISFAAVLVTAPRAGEYLVSLGGGDATTALRVERFQFNDLSLSPADAVALASVVGAGTTGRDTLTGAATADFLLGDAGDDVLTGAGGNDTLAGGDGGDVLDGGAGDDLLLGGNGDDLLSGGAGINRIEGGAGFDTVHLDIPFADATVALLPDGDYVITGAAGAFVTTVAGVELLAFSDLSIPPDAALIPAGITRNGGPGPDTLTGGDGPDWLAGGGGNDVLRGHGANDTLLGGDGADTLNGGDGDDSILGGETGGDQRDLIFGGDGDDFIDGGFGNDEINGMGGNDTLLGGFGADTVVGGDGDDVITGSAFSDLIFGNAGADFVNGGFGHDRVNGGAGGDKFFHLGILDHGSDWIQDFSHTEGDVLLFGQAGATASQFQVNLANTPDAGSAAVADAFVIYIPTGQIIWALVDGGAQTSINLQIPGSGDTFDLLG